MESVPSASADGLRDQPSFFDPFAHANGTDPQSRNSDQLSRSSRPIVRKGHLSYQVQDVEARLAYGRASDTHSAGWRIKKLRITSSTFESGGNLFHRSM